MMICREFCKNPDEIRSWEFEDYKSAMDSICEIPGLANMLYGFFKNPEDGKTPQVALTTKEEREKFLDSLKEKT